MANTEKSTDRPSDSNQSSGSNSPNLGVNFDRWVSLVNPTDLGRADGSRNIPGVEATHCDFDRKIQQMAANAIGGQTRNYLTAIADIKSRLAQIEATPEIHRFTLLTANRGVNRYLNPPLNYFCVAAIAILMALALAGIAWKGEHLDVSTSVLSVVLACTLAFTGYLGGFGARTKALPTFLLIVASATVTLVGLVGVWYVAGEHEFARALASGLSMTAALAGAMVGWLSHDSDPEIDRLYSQVPQLIQEQARLRANLLSTGRKFYELAKKAEHVAVEVSMEYRKANIAVRADSTEIPHIFFEDVQITPALPAAFGLQADGLTLAQSNAQSQNVVKELA